MELIEKNEYSGNLNQWGQGVKKIIIMSPREMDTNNGFVKLVKELFPECEIEIFQIFLDSEDFQEGDTNVPRRKCS